MWQDTHSPAFFLCIRDFPFSPRYVIHTLFPSQALLTVVLEVLMRVKRPLKDKRPHFPNSRNNLYSAGIHTRGGQRARPGARKNPFSSAFLPPRIMKDAPLFPWDGLTCKFLKWGREGAQQLRAHAVFAENPHQALSSSARSI